jgi:hypothetical protein
MHPRVGECVERVFVYVCVRSRVCGCVCVCVCSLLLSSLLLSPAPSLLSLIISQHSFSFRSLIFCRPSLSFFPLLLPLYLLVYLSFLVSDQPLIWPENSACAVSLQMVEEEMSVIEEQYRTLGAELEAANNAPESMQLLERATWLLLVCVRSRCSLPCA